MKKIGKVLYTVLTWLLVAVAVFMMAFTIISVLTFDKNDRDVFGFKAFTVLSDSMKATDFAAGDVIIVKEVDPTTLKVGDIISFQSLDKESYGEVVTHKIRELTKNEDGAPGFRTYGTTTGVNDDTIVTYSFVLGKYQFKLPYVGMFFQFLKTTPGYIVCILIPFLALIIVQGVNSVRAFRAYRKEQLREMQEERDRLIAEQEEQKRKMEEERLKLLEEQKRTQEFMAQLQAQMAAMQSDQQPPVFNNPTTPATAAPVVTPPAEAAPAEAAPAEAVPEETKPKTTRKRTTKKATEAAPSEDNANSDAATAAAPAENNAAPADEAPAEAPVKKTPGRKKKTVAAEPAADGVVASAPETAPAAPETTADAPEAPAAESAPAADGEAPAPKKRGRKKKVVADDTAAGDTAVSAEDKPDTDAN